MKNELLCGWKFYNDIDDDVNDETYCEKEKLLNVQIPLEWGVGKC